MFWCYVCLVFVFITCGAAYGHVAHAFHVLDAECDRLSGLVDRISAEVRNHPLNGGYVAVPANRSFDAKAGRPCRMMCNG
jgi:hypothetical protein